MEGTRRARTDLPHKNRLQLAAVKHQAALACGPFDECEDVRLDDVGIRGHHAAWEAARVNLERASKRT